MVTNMNGNLQLMGEKEGEIYRKRKKKKHWDKGGTQESVGVTLAVSPEIGVWNLERPSPVARQEPQWSNRDTNPPTKFQPKIYPDYKKWRHGGWSRDRGNDHSITGPT